MHVFDLSDEREPGGGSDDWDGFGNGRNWLRVDGSVERVVGDDHEWRKRVGQRLGWLLGGGKHWRGAKWNDDDRRRDVHGEPGGGIDGRDADRVRSVGERIAGDDGRAIDGEGIELLR